MQTNVNPSKPYRIYDKSLKEWLEVPADYYKEYDRERTAYRKRIVTMLDQQEAPGPRMEDVIADRDLLARLIKRLRELDPDADAILALWQEDYTISDRAIAKALGRPQRTFADQMKRIRTELRKVRGY